MSRPSDLPSEFELIARYFAPLATHEGARGLADDVAVLAPAPGKAHVLTVDTIVEGVHYLPEDPPQLVARKLLRVNLSDLAAKGARPVGYLLAASFGKSVTADWLAAFASGLAADQETYGLSLLGGDTTANPGPTTLSVTVIGEAEERTVVRRSGAKPGEGIYVSGTLGDAALGLRAIRGELSRLETSDREFLAGRFRLPEPRLALGQALLGVASATIDISDGLIADLGHVCQESAVRAEVALEDVPLSAAARRALAVDPALRDDVLGGGDDYEILFTASPNAERALTEAAMRARLAFSRIGTIREGAGIEVTDRAGRPVAVKHAGFRHF
jgi:thiamine-monophosphate kinase